MFYIGIDEAGRGPVLGPMVLAGVLADEREIAEFKELNVRDSKMIMPKRREFLSKEIKKIAISYYIIKVNPREIDEKISQKINLNKIEALKVAEIINILIKKVPEAEVIVDCPSPNTRAWSNYLAEYIHDTKKIKLRCEHKADVNYPVVSAASILAKVTRDSEVEKIKRQHNIECGSGYPSDPICQKFLTTSKAKELAKIGLIRKSWATWKNEVKRRGQRKLLDF
ncbi:MAG: ribonuclease HII [Candidatus Pacearchaeota archaeon]|nr:MAG: ribonuclease HII [Candidatus Pacearchaeota archaeon]